MAQQATWAAAGTNTPTFMEEEIKRLKGRLEKKMTEPYSKAHWKDMVEDCGILLSHFESSTPKAGQENSSRACL